jgi:hypothetical protein
MNSESHNAHAASHNYVNVSEMKAHGPAVEFARCFLRLANLPNFALDRLSRYEAALWRQASRIVYALETLDRRKPQERTRHFWLGPDSEPSRLFNSVFQYCRSQHMRFQAMTLADLSIGPTPANVAARSFRIRLHMDKVALFG